LEDLAKYSYKTEIKQNLKIILLHVWLYNENQIYKYDDDRGWMMMMMMMMIIIIIIIIIIFPSLLATKNLPNHCLKKKKNSFWRNFASKRKNPLGLPGNNKTLFAHSLC
jgi:hypothetical protein